jgi:hypothetical protein
VAKPDPLGLFCIMSNTYIGIGSFTHNTSVVETVSIDGYRILYSIQYFLMSLN